MLHQFWREREDNFLKHAHNNNDWQIFIQIYTIKNFKKLHLKKILSDECDKPFVLIKNISSEKMLVFGWVKVLRKPDSQN